MNLPATANSLLKTSLFFLLLLVFQQVNAQFSYAGFSLGYTWENLEKGNNILSDSEDYSRINELTATLSFMNRPIRRVGLGASIRIPVFTGFKWSFNDSPSTSSGGYFEIDNEFGAESSAYNPSEYDYKVKNRIGITLVGRLYFSDEDSWYFDVRYTFASVNESFIFKRSASNGAPARFINYNENHSIRGPGFELGGLAQFDDHFYFTYGFVMDFISYDVIPFKYTIEHGEDAEVTMTSRIQESAYMFQFHYGIGYRF